MKKLFILPMLFFIVSAQSITVKAFEPTNNSMQTQSTNSVKEYIENEVNNLNKNTNTQTHDIIKNNVYNRLSQYMKDKSKLYDIYIVDDSVTNIPVYRSQSKRTLANINYAYSFILMQNTTDCNTRTPEHTLFHELGHALDTYDELDNYNCKVIGKYSNSYEFKQIFEDEKNYLKNLSKEYYFMDKPNEYFAECFAIYMENSVEMKEKAPKTFEFIDKVANK